MPGVSFQALLSLAPSSAITYPLDLIGTSASAAYSTRKLRTAYAGSCIKVRRSSDNTTQDIGFDAATGLIDTASIATFCGAGDGFVDTWYDQSTNARNAVQATQANQPQIYSSGAMITSINSKPSVQFDGSNDTLTLADYITLCPAAGYSVFTSVRPTAGGSSSTGYTNPNVLATANARFGISFQDTGTGAPRAWIYHNNAATLASDATTSVTFTGLIAVRYDLTGTSLNIYYNGGTPGNATGAQGNSQTLNMGGGYSTYYYTGTVAEMIFFDSTVSTTNSNTLADALASYAGVTWTSI